jgi:hypothetical protein
MGLGGFQILWLWKERHMVQTEVRAGLLGRSQGSGKVGRTEVEGRQEPPHGPEEGGGVQGLRMVWK